jgi:carbon-monoxide dehydrogenase large subunit
VRRRSSRSARRWRRARRWFAPNAKHNTVVETSLDAGDVPGAFAAATEIVEFAFILHRQSAMPREARAPLAQFDRATPRVTLSISAQAPHMVRTGVADVVGMPENDLRVIAPVVGG